jgi:uncharacterized protein (DUF4415 family)
MARHKTKSGTYQRRKSLKTDPTLNDVPDMRTWMVAERGEFYRPVKEQITLRLDKDVIAWFKAGGEGYQTRINEALREYVLSKLSEEAEEEGMDAKP